MKKKLKVLFVIDTLYNAGAENSLLEITSKFKHVKPVFVHIYEENALKEKFEQHGLKVHSLNVPGNWNFKIALERLKSIYKEESPDIVHSTLFRSDILTRKLKKKFPNILLINSFVNDSYNAKRLEKLSLLRKIKGKIIQFWDSYSARNVDHFISNSETIKISKSQGLNIPLKKIEVIYRGRDKEKLISDMDQNKIKNIKVEYELNNSKVLLNVGRLIDSKGQKDVIEGMPQILKVHPNTILLIAGEGICRKPLEFLIHDLGLEKSVVLLGNRNDIPELLAVSDIFVFPTYLEGLPGALIEAMMSKTLICCSDIPVNLECVSEKSAIIFKVGDREDITKKINFALSNLSHLRNKSEVALSDALNKFDIVKIAEKYENFYVSIIKKA